VAASRQLEALSLSFSLSYRAELLPLDHARRAFLC